MIIRGDHFRFGLVFIKKSNQIEFFLKKPKPVQTLLGFFRFGSVFFPVFPAWVRCDFFSFRLIKSKPNQTGRFFQNFNWFNWFFSQFGFLVIFFSSDFLDFPVFLLTHNDYTLFVLLFII